MYLTSFTLRQFRNYTEIQLSLSPNLNLFIGPNGSGKSNILESLAVLSTGQSHRGAEQKNLIQWEKDGLALTGKFEGEESVLVEMRQKKGRPRQVTINNRFQRRLSDWVGRIPVISFSPDDLNLVKGEPSIRRRNMNSVLMQTDLEYAETFQKYTKILEERNAALRQIQDGKKPKSILEPWNKTLIQEGSLLTLKRYRFLLEFSEKVRQHHHGISTSKEKVSLVYKSSFLLLEPDLEKIISTNRQRLEGLREGEIALGSTLIGPHRDDIEFILNDNSAKAFASQGQQRTFALSFKLAARAYLKDKVGRSPICLLDDMLSELDAKRRENLTKSLVDGYQCLITATALAEWPEAATLYSQTEIPVFEIQNGVVQKDVISKMSQIS